MHAAPVTQLSQNPPPPVTPGAYDFYMEEEVIDTWSAAVSNPTVPVYRPGDVEAEAEVRRALQEEFDLPFEPTLSFKAPKTRGKLFLRWLRRRLLLTQ